MSKELEISDQDLRLGDLFEFCFKRNSFSSLKIANATLERVRRGHHNLLAVLESGVALYGVTTGFGDSSSRLISSQQCETLQANLISYLLCGTGPSLPTEASRAMMVIRLKSLCRGLSGVSPELIERLRLFIERDWVPVVPREGSLGASGDLIPLAYLGRVLQGGGRIHCGDSIRDTAEVLKEHDIEPYSLKAKEGLAIVNGTSTMAGLALVNLRDASRLVALATLATSWTTLVLSGRRESFGALVNEKAKSHPGQSQAAKAISAYLDEELYETPPLPKIGKGNTIASTPVQDRYSLRCAPQILGPIIETIGLNERWLETEINGVSDNPLIDDDGSFANGGNFYGGHLSQGMDYLKISLANLADMIDRQLMLIFDEKVNRGLPANLAAWDRLPDADRFLHHGLKGLHQATSAVTSEILARATPNSIFSRSSESHNQDKVSLGMSAAVQCSEMITSLFTTTTMHLICLAQALDLKEITLRGDQAANSYALIRNYVPFVAQDMPLGERITDLRDVIRSMPTEKIVAKGKR